MGSDFNFRGYGAEPPAEAAGIGMLPGDFVLPRQTSIYSLTFDEFQSTVGGIGKDFGSMNMDELLKNIWSAEEINSNLGSTSGVVDVNKEGSGHLQRQGSLTLPRTLSQKTVDEVWRDIAKDFENEKGSSANLGVASEMNFQQAQRQPTLGEITLEEFLVRAGVVREEIQPDPEPNPISFTGKLSVPMNSNSGTGFVFQHQQQSGAGLMGGLVSDNVNPSSSHSTNLGLDSKGARTAVQQQSFQQLSPQNHHRLLPKQAYGSTIRLQSNHGTRNGVLDIPEQTLNFGLPGGGFGLGVNGVTITSGSPVISPNGLAESNGEPSYSASPIPYSFNGSLSGRKTATFEKVVERRQRRMIKNRESAARSRARKQAYTVELEGEVAKLKEESDALRKREVELMEMHKNQVQEIMNQQENKRRCARRTLSGPW